MWGLEANWADEELIDVEGVCVVAISFDIY